MELPYQDLKTELDELKNDVRRLDNKICLYEENPHFQMDDVRYRRLVDEKQLLLGHLCDLRKNIYMKIFAPYINTSIRITNGETNHIGNNEESSNLPPAKRAKTNNKRSFGELELESSQPESHDQEMGYFIDRNEDKVIEDNASSFHSSLQSKPAVIPSLPTITPKTEENFPPPYQGSTATQPLATTSASSSITNDNPIPQNQPIPALQLEEYLQMKMKLAQIMRDFNDKKICFIGSDNSRIFVQQYQQISSRVKNGEDISNFLRGKILMFVTAVDKKKRSLTETKLFIPDYEPTK